jgi:hypothetical protein
MNNPDQEVLIFAFKDAARIIAEHLAPGRNRDPEETVTRLIRTLNRPEVIRAIERLESERRVLKRRKTRWCELVRNARAESVQRVKFRRCWNLRSAPSFS